MSKKRLMHTIHKFPTWATCLAEYGFDDNLTDSDIAEFEEFMQGLRDEYSPGYLVFPDLDEEASFTHHPAFGLACNTVKAVYVVHP